MGKSGKGAFRSPVETKGLRTTGNLDLSYHGDPHLRDALDAVVSAAGGRREIERRLGRSRGFVRKVIEGSQRYPRVIEILQAAGIHPGTFFRQLYPDVESIPDPDLHLPNPLLFGLTTGKDPDSSLSTLLGDLFEQAEASDATRRVDSADHAGAEAILEKAAALDEDRYSDPATAAIAARELLGRVADLRVHPIRRAAIACKVAGVLGSSFRTAARLREAGWVLAKAIDLSQTYASSEDQADLLLRAGAVLMARGDYSAAHRLAGQAQNLYAAAADFVGVGKCWVHQGAFLFLEGQLETSAETFRAGLRMLPRSKSRYHASAFNGLALICQQQGDLEAAERHLLEAESCRALDLYTRALIKRSRGDIARAAEHLEKAARLYGDARDMLLNINPVDAALAGIDAAASLIDLGRIDEATRTARKLGSLVDPLSMVDTVAETVVLELLVTIARGDKISRRQIESFRREITAAVKRQD